MEDLEPERVTHISLLDTVRFEDVGGFANFLQELFVGQLDVLSRFISFPNDRSLSRKPVNFALEVGLKWREFTLLGCL